MSKAESEIAREDRGEAEARAKRIAEAKEAVCEAAKEKRFARQEYSEALSERDSVEKAGPNSDLAYVAPERRVWAASERRQEAWRAYEEALSALIQAEASGQSWH